MHTEEQSCRIVRRLLDAYLSSELLVETSAEILEHLDECSNCSALLDSRLRTRTALKQAAAKEAVPLELVADIRHALTRPRVMPGVMQGRWAAAVVLFAILAGGAGLLYLRPRPEPAAADSERILNMALNAVRQCPAESGLDYLGWEYNGLAEILREEMPSSYGITGARRCVLDGRLFIHVVLEAGDSRVSFVVTEKAEDHLSTVNSKDARSVAGVPVYSMTIGNHQVAGFETRSHLAFFVSPNLTRDDNLQLASSIAALHAPLVRSTLKEAHDAH